MRMRRKRNLDERLAAVSDYIIERTVLDKNMRTSIEQKDYVDFCKVFGNSNPVELEIGCGKGAFIVTLAKRNPNVNYLAIEMLSNVIVEACEKAKKENLKNVRFMILRAECLESYVPEKSISKIYLNFSTPLPQKGYEKQRLTHAKFLNIYKRLLIGGGEICQKTDSPFLFEFSLVQYSSCGYILKDVKLDLLRSNCENNIMTEYELKFAQMDAPIYRIVAYLPTDEEKP
ncbi:MAG: tRNA (guanosine(46)-N7)-methyltransferase TrmB [Clostridia bacterium]|nr:tRNA (guanosine(46)-N7)-methyltransferase TrmB [Clostridia bacterium]MDE7328182.1 tRNA (guanosine(46)-N7)-methyltransferase TrmB [Clostridia bacterium]